QRRTGFRRGRQPRLRQLPQVLPDHAGQVVRRANLRVFRFWKNWGLISHLILAVGIVMHAPGLAAQQTHSFYVLHQRTIALTAQYWNPILTYVGKKSGVPLELKLAKTAAEGNAMAEA